MSSVDVFDKFDKSTAKVSPTESEVRWALKMRTRLWTLTGVLIAIGLGVFWWLAPSVFVIFAAIGGIAVVVIGALLGLHILISVSMDVSQILSKAKQWGVLEDE